MEKKKKNYVEHMNTLSGQKIEWIRNVCVCGAVFCANYVCESQKRHITEAVDFSRIEFIVIELTIRYR